MLFRFCLYGFLKNLKFFEPVFYLILLNEKNLSFSMLGMLVGFGGVCVNLMEVPSGAVADLYGRRHCMILSFFAYILSFIIFALARHVVWLFAAMFFFSFGEAFRTGTHKAIIFGWLRSQGLESERTKYYGITRSWSKIGSAVSAVLGLAFMLGWMAFNAEAQYSDIFLLCVIPYIIAIINFLGYPAENENKSNNLFIKVIILHLWDTVKDAIKSKNLRRLFVESMGFEGVFKTIKDYVQPIAAQMILGLSALLVFKDKEQQTVILVYAIYFLLNLFAIYGSRISFQLSEKMDGEDAGCRLVWWLSLVIYIVMGPLLYFKLYSVSIFVFIGLHFLQNIWRPMLISRFDSCSRPETGATILSIESQAKSLFMIIVAPVLGFIIDIINSNGYTDQSNFWPVAVPGVAIGLYMVLIKPASCKNA